MDSRLVDILENEVAGLIESLRMKLADGSLSAREVGSFLQEFLRSVILLAEAIEGASGKEKREFVIAATLRLWDCALVKLDIPWVPDTIADPAIRATLPIIVGWIVNAWVGYFNASNRWPPLPQVKGEET